jgi:hypothetical protein
MSFNVSDFKSNLAKGGIIQTNKYDVRIVFDNPSLFSSYVTDSKNNVTSLQELANDLSYRCVNATLPGVALRTSDNNRFGLGIIEKMPMSAGYTDVNLTFICDKYGEVYKFWYAWINFIFAATGEENTSIVSTLSSKRTFYTAEYKNNYSSTINITSYSNDGVTALTYNLLKAYPIAINDTPLSWEDNNNLVKLTTTITFREWSIDNNRIQLQLSNA